MQVCHDLLNKYEAESDGFKDCIITGDKMRCHHYDPKIKMGIHGVATVNFPIEEKVQDTALSG